MTAKVYIQTNGYSFTSQSIEQLKASGYTVETLQNESQSSNHLSRQTSSELSGNTTRPMSSNLPSAYYDLYFICVNSPHEFHRYAKNMTPSLASKLVFITNSHFPYRVFSEGQWPQIQWDIVGEQWDGAVLEQIVRKYVQSKQKIEIESYPNFVHFETPSTLMKNFEDSFQKGIMHAAQTSASSIVITGEKGVGKRHMTEHLIRTYLPAHALYKVCLEDFNGNSEMVEKVLFGDPSAYGCLESAATGFVYIQEVQLLSKALQERLGRCLIQKSITHKSMQGEDVTIPLGCHVILSSSEDIGFLVRSGKFSEVLLNHSGPYKFEMPHLAARLDDIVSLAGQMIGYFNTLNNAKCDGLNESAISTLKQYPWPHNTEELLSCFQVMVAPNFSGPIDQVNVPDQYKPKGKTQLSELLPTTPMPYQLAKQNLVDYFNDYYAHFLLNHTQFNFSAAARLAGMDRSNFRRLFKEYLGDHYSKEGAHDQEHEGHDEMPKKKVA